MNPIKALANRFVSLPPLVRMRVTKTLLEIYTSGSSEKSFLEVFWDEVEKAHGDHSNGVNPFMPVGNLSSQLFGESLSTAGGFGGGGGGGNPAAGNRRIIGQVRFSF